LFGYSTPIWKYYCKLTQIFDISCYFQVQWAKEIILHEVTLLENNVKIGMKAEKSEQVTQDTTAIKYGSGGVAVYATPAMIGLMEGTCLAAVDPFLPEGMATVGIDLNVKHLAATPVGMTVRATAELTEISGKRLTFSVTAYDEKEKIGEGTHQRYIIDVAKFVEKTNAKK
jgi:fluoroacetyl-CoA thioesterase